MKHLLRQRFKKHRVLNMHWDNLGQFGTIWIVLNMHCYFWDNLDSKTNQRL